MNLYTGILFVHAIAVLVLTAALTMEAWILLELRRVVHPADFRPWAGTIQPVSVAAISSLVIIFVTGAYLTQSLRSWEYAWPRVAVLEIALFALLGAITGSRMRAIRRYTAADKTNPSQWTMLSGNPFLKISLSTRIWIVMGTILLTAAKPGLGESLGIAAGSLILGLLSSFISIRRRSVAAPAQPASR